MTELNWPELNTVCVARGDIGQKSPGMISKLNRHLAASITITAISTLF